MQLDSLVAALGGAAVVAAGAGMWLKGTLDRLLDSKLKRLEEERKLEWSERLRRQAKLYDAQMEPLRALVSNLYRARLSARELSKGMPRGPLVATGDELRRLKSFHSSYSELLIEARAYLPFDVHMHLHGMKHRCEHFLATAEATLRNPSVARDSSEIPSPTDIKWAPPDDLLVAFKELDDGYDEVLQAVQKHMRADPGEA